MHARQRRRGTPAWISVYALAEDGQIIEERVYWDMATLLATAGVLGWLDCLDRPEPRRVERPTTPPLPMTESPRSIDLRLAYQQGREPRIEIL